MESHLEAQEDRLSRLVITRETVEEILGAATRLLREPAGSAGVVDMVEAADAQTQAYLVVFQDDLIRSYRAFLDKRRASRPSAEYREPAEEELDEFERHFELRKVELGTCDRPYGTPCAHEHACVRCPMLRVDPAQRRRLEEVIRNLVDRIGEAQVNGWLGESKACR
ncbi:hypothetical protein GCM10022226_83250 [Sphaerisporangium flaviroseum]|uniref:Uncharacterized protein n=1 Tax=Sphaerisporangium flaviroseum TaxID=509199 RepID=A0ABP7JK83_9ACTN